MSPSASELLVTTEISESVEYTGFGERVTNGASGGVLTRTIMFVLDTRPLESVASRNIV